jgi:hypothetical protein
VLHRQAMQPAPNSSVPPRSAREGRSASHRPLRHIPADLHGKCFNCLSSAHRVATCKLPQRCLRCKGLRHVARDCKQPRRMDSRSSFDRAPSSSGTISTPDGQPRRRVREPTPGNWLCAHGGTFGTDRATSGMATAWRGCERWWGGAGGGDVTDVDVDVDGRETTSRWQCLPTTSVSLLLLLPHHISLSQIHLLW